MGLFFYLLVGGGLYFLYMYVEKSKGAKKQNPEAEDLDELVEMLNQKLVQEKEEIEPRAKKVVPPPVRKSATLRQQTLRREAVARKPLVKSTDTEVVAKKDVNVAADKAYGEVETWHSDIMDDFSIRKAIIYAEIMKPKYED